MHAKQDAKQDFTAGIVPEVRAIAPWRVCAIEVLPNFSVFLEFVDGARGVVDLKPVIFGENPGVFKALQDEALFAQALLSYGTLAWPNGLDLAPEFLKDCLV